jgi:7-cyano-7-deazaguanine reductase
MHATKALGHSSAYDAPFSPALLESIPRQLGRIGLGLGAPDPMPFLGYDLWTAYELSWLEPSGKPAIGVGAFWVPAQSACLVESKSFKLYLGSLAQAVWADLRHLEAILAEHLSAAVGGKVGVRIFGPAELPMALRPHTLLGTCLDGLPLKTAVYQVDPGLLKVRAGEVAGPTQVYTDLFRSNCPVTGQPDWGSIAVDYQGPTIDLPSLLAYLISYRLHVGFHEQCIERIFVDLQRECGCEALAVHGRFTRRGGLDINPYRTTGDFSGRMEREMAGESIGRLWRQ